MELVRAIEARRSLTIAAGIGVRRDVKRLVDVAQEDEKESQLLVSA
jgi:hypothetical protein